MKKIITYIILTSVLLFIACGLEDPSRPALVGVTQGQLLLLKMVAVGNSLTAGVQSAGIVEDFQLNSYPYLIAQQIGAAAHFEQPLVGDPGLSSTPGVGVLDFVNGEIVPRGTYTNPLALLRNAEVPRPYDNLGIPGANVGEILNATNSTTGPQLTDVILRNPNFGNTTVAEQAKLLNPTLVLLWAGNNDVLGAAVDGGDLTQITDPTSFQADLVSLLTELGKIRDGNLGIVMANIPNVTDIPYVNILDNLVYKAIPALGINDPVPVVFDATFQPVLFDTTIGLYLPLLTEETDVQHLLLPFLSEYQATGLGVPDSAALRGFGLSSAQARDLVQGMIAAGLLPSGVPVPGSLTITITEGTTIEQAVAGFNQIIAGIAGSEGIPLVDVNALLSTLNTAGLDGYSGLFVFLDPANTAFSLDGIHPNNGGYAIIANAFIDVLNAIPGLNLSIPKLTTANYKGQYLGTSINKISREAAIQVKGFFSRN